MTGHALVDFLITLVALGGAAALFFVAVDSIAPDATFKRIAKIGIGCMLLIALIVAVAGVLGLGGAGFAVHPLGVLYFAVGLIVALVVLYLANLLIDWIAGQMGPPSAWVVPVKYVLGALVLIALMLLAANTLFGVDVGVGLGGRSR